MGKKSKEVTTYIANAEPFARPILRHLRKLVHQAVPDVEETIKWIYPHFVYKGNLCHIAAFKHHAAFGFWTDRQVKDTEKIFVKGENREMGHLGKLTSLKDLPSDEILIRYIKGAAKANVEGRGKQKVKKRPQKELVIPDYFMSALKKNKNALKTFNSFSYSNQKDYVEWVTEAKRESTRDKRLAQAVEWLAEGKPRNWKYRNC